MSRRAGWLAQIGLYDDCYALCLPLCLLGLGSQVGTSVGRGCLLFGDVCRSRLCVGVWRLGDCLLGPWLLPTWHGGHPGLLVVCVVGATGAAARVSFVVSFVCEAVRGFLCFPCIFCPLLFRIYFLGLLKPAWFWWCGGAHCLKRVIPGGLCSSRCCGGSPLFPVLSCVTVGHWVIGRPRNRSRGGLPELLVYRFLGFLVLALLTVHSAQ